MKRKALMVCALLALCAAAFAPLGYAQETAAAAETSAEASAGAGAEAHTETAVQAGDAASDSGWKYIAAAIAVGMSCLAGGIAVGRVGAAAMGAISENPDLSGKALLYAGLAEGICLWGFLVALLILFL
jgi:V/A-type H+-transporting ATPase subunit K